MPAYDYDCPKCGLFEAHHSMFEPNLTRCPKCRAPVTKAISLPRFKRPLDWSDQCGGRGQWISQIADSTTDPTAFCRSPAELIEKAKRKGFNKIEKVG